MPNGPKNYVKTDTRLDTDTLTENNDDRLASTQKTAQKIMEKLHRICGKMGLKLTRFA